MVLHSGQNKAPNIASCASSCVPVQPQLWQFISIHHHQSTVVRAYVHMQRVASLTFRPLKPLGMGNLEFNDHHVGAGFHQGVCSGDHSSVDSPCPHYVPKGEEPPQRCQESNTGKIAQMIGNRLCGLCCCPMASLGLLSAPPTEEKGCPRVAEHRRHG